MKSQADVWLEQVTNHPYIRPSHMYTATLLAYLFNRTKDETGIVCWEISKRQLFQSSMLSEGTVKNHLRALEHHGLITTSPVGICMKFTGPIER